MRGDRGRQRDGQQRQGGGWLLFAAWLFIALPGLGFAAWLAAPTPWLDILGLPRPGASSGQAVVVTLPALPGYLPGQPPAKAAPRGTWQQWRAPAPSVPAGRPVVAVVLSGLGRSGAVTEAASALPGPIALAFSPYGRPFGTAIEVARAAGHEILIELPMKGEAKDGEGADSLDLGPQALLPLLDASQNLKRLDWLLDGAEAPLPLVAALVVGGGGFLRAEDVAAPVLAELSRRGLILLLSGPAAPAERLADAAGLTLVLADQAAADAAASTLALAAAERMALLQGAAIVVLPADAGTVARLAAWAGTLEARGFTLVPTTYVVERRLAN